MKYLTIIYQQELMPNKQECGEAEVKKQLIKGELEGFQTQGQYKVKVYKDGGVPLEQYEAVLRRALKAEAKLEQIKMTVI